MNKIESEIALVISSCDAFVDTWDPHLQALRKFWPDKGFSTYLITNHLRPSFSDVRIIAVGDDISWSDNLLVALEKISESYILLHIDDLILCRHVDHSAVMAAIAPFIVSKGNYLRLNPTPAGQGVESVSAVAPGDSYRTSTQFSLWRKDVLQTLLRSGETAWDFEIKGSVRSDSFGSWYASKPYLLKHVNLIIKSKIDPVAANVLRGVGVLVTSNRQVLSKRELVILGLKELRSKIFYFILPKKIARDIRNLFDSA